MAVTLAGFVTNDFGGIPTFATAFNNSGNPHTVNQINSTTYRKTGINTTGTLTLDNVGTGWRLTVDDGLGNPHSTNDQANTSCAAIPTGGYGDFPDSESGATGSVA